MIIKKDGGYQRQIEDLQLLAVDAPAGYQILNECLEVAEMLINKNISYGNSALNPIRTFSKADAQEQIRVRIDDKLNRIKNQQAFPGDNDIDDLIGYLILLKVSNQS